MRHVHILHKEVVVAYYSLAFGGCSAVYGHILADAVVVTNLSGSILTLELKILRDTAYHGSGMYLITIAYA